jgi:hypothetical protein
MAVFPPMDVPIPSLLKRDARVTLRARVRVVSVAALGLALCALALFSLGCQHAHRGPWPDPPPARAGPRHTIGSCRRPRPTSFWLWVGPAAYGRMRPAHTKPTRRTTWTGSRQQRSASGTEGDCPLRRNGSTRQRVGTRTGSIPGEPRRPMRCARTSRSSAKRERCSRLGAGRSATAAGAMLTWRQVCRSGRSTRTTAPGIRMRRPAHRIRAMRQTPASGWYAAAPAPTKHPSFALRSGAVATGPTRGRAPVRAARGDQQATRLTVRLRLPPLFLPPVRDLVRRGYGAANRVASEAILYGIERGAQALLLVGKQGQLS